MESQAIRVALVEDQQLVRAGFRMVISSQPDMEVVLEHDSGTGAAQLVRQAGPDIVLMDVQMPGLDGISATREIVSVSGPKVVVLTTFANDDYLYNALAAGASGFLLKDADPEDLLDAIRKVHHGDAVIAPSMTRRLIERVGPQLGAAATPAAPAALPPDLTPRELDVLRLIGRGATNTEIAHELFLSEATVKSHVGRVLAKTGSRDRVQAVLFAVRASVVDLDELR